MSGVDAEVSSKRLSRMAGDGRTHWLKAHYDKLNYQDYSYYSDHRAVIVTTLARLNLARCSKWRERLFK